MLGCWDSFGTLFLMSALVLIGKLVRMLNGASEWVAGLLPEEVRDCWALAQDKEAAVRQKKRRERGTEKNTYLIYRKKSSCEVCLRKDNPLAHHPFLREASEEEASLSDNSCSDQSVRYLEKKEELTCATKNWSRKENPFNLPETFESVPSRRATKEPEQKTDSHSEYGSDIEDFEMEQGQQYTEAQGSRRNLPEGLSTGFSAPVPVVTNVNRLPMPVPGSLGVPLFEGANATEFLDNFDDLCDEYAVAEQQKLMKLPKYCSRSVGDSIKSHKAWVAKDYPALRRAILMEYRIYDTHQQMYSVEFLDRYKSIKRTDKDDILQYCRKYHMIASFLFEKGAFNKCHAGVWFLQGLPSSMRANVMRKYKIIGTEPHTVNYDQIMSYVEETTTSEQAIKDMDRESASPREGKGDELGQLAKRFHAGCEIPKERRFGEQESLHYPGATPKQTPEMESLTESLRQMSIGIATMVQSGAALQTPKNAQGQKRRDGTTQGTSTPRAGVTPESGFGYERPPPGAFVEANLGTAAAIGTLNTNRKGEGVCYYCHNREPDFPPHKFRAQCPWYNYHLKQGTIHLNKANRLCLGPEREGAPEIFLTRDAPHGAQVRMRTAGTEFDEYVKDRPREKTVSGPSTAVQGLTFIAEESSSDEDEEEVEGFGIVKERDITEANASRIETPPPNTKEKWVNPTKILKRKVEKEKEKTYAVGKGLRLGSWEPAQVSEPEPEPEQFDIELPDAPPEEKKKEKTPERAKVTRKVAPRKKYMDILKEEQDPEALLKEIMDTRVNIRLRDIITSSESLMKLMFRNLPAQKQGDDNIPVAKIGATTLSKPERAYAAATPRIRVRIGDLTTEALLDTGAEVNVMTRALANRANLPIRTNIRLALKTVSGEKRSFDGACEEVEVSIGNIKNIQTIMVVDSIDHKLILGCPFSTMRSLLSYTMRTAIKMPGSSTKTEQKKERRGFVALRADSIGRREPYPRKSL
jgi:predicted aspartyl protease